VAAGATSGEHLVQAVEMGEALGGVDVHVGTVTQGELTLKCLFCQCHLTDNGGKGDNLEELVCRALEQLLSDLGFES